MITPDAIRKQAKSRWKRWKLQIRRCLFAVQARLVTIRE